MTKTYDVALIGGGIMSATLGALLTKLQPDWSIVVFERLADLAQESSNPWNNAGTGHAALCELNYSPEVDGVIPTAKAIDINEQFQLSRQFWATLVEDGDLPDPSSFISATPHMSFVWGAENVDYLRRRWQGLKDHPLFQGMEFTDDARVIRTWAPLLIPGRAKDQPIAATRIVSGTDVDFGALTRALFEIVIDGGGELRFERAVTKLRRGRDGIWNLLVRHEVGMSTNDVRAKFVFVGAGGGALKLLQKSGIPEAKGFGGFPITGEFLRTDNPKIVERHLAKVYGKASVGAPPMSVPHLDTRVVNGESSLLFGPYAGWSPKYLKTGSYADMFETIKWHNLYPMIRAGLANLGLVRYLFGEVFATRQKQIEALQEFVPHVNPDDWYSITAGQRVQVMKKDAKKGGVLQFGTEVIAGADGTIAGLLGASPGASTAVPIMLNVLERCFPSKLAAWRPELTRLVPSYGTKLSDDPERAIRSLQHTARVLKIDDPSFPRTSEPTEVAPSATA